MLISQTVLKISVNTKQQHQLVCDQSFRGGGVVDGEGVAVKDAWSGVVGVGEGKSCS